MFAFGCGALRVVQVGVGTARQPRVVPIPAPLEGVAVHVVQPPSVGGITADRAARPSDGPCSAPLYGFPLKFACLLPSVSPNEVAVVVPARQAYSHCASVGRRNSQSFGRTPDWRPTFGEFPAERFGLGEVDIANREVVARGQLRGELARQLPDDPLPLALRRLVLGHPKASGQCHLDLIFSRPPFGFVAWASHDEAAGRTPAELDGVDFALLASVPAAEGSRRLLCQHPSCSQDRRGCQCTTSTDRRVIRRPSLARIWPTSVLSSASIAETAKSSRGPTTASR